jgi:hypothetical protein
MMDGGCVKENIAPVSKKAPHRKYNNCTLLNKYQSLIVAIIKQPAEEKILGI